MLELNKTIYIVVLFTIMASCSSAPKKDPNKTYFDSPADYNTYISQQFDEVNRLWNATLAVMDDSTLAYKELDSLATTSFNSMGNMIKLANFKGDSLYRKAAQDYFEYMYKTATHEFKEAIDIMLMPDINDSLSFRFTAIGNQMGSDKDSIINKLTAAQAHFIELNNKPE